ncbi:MAG: hypothetical protein ACRCXK_13150 [Wohlfahrtiimonas sp.]
MNLMKINLVVVLSVMLAACSGIAGYMDTKDEIIQGEGVKISETIQEKDMYGAWAISTDNNDPNDVLLMFSFYADHTGLVYVSNIDRKRKSEHISIEYFTWTLDEKKKELYSNVVRQVETINGKKRDKQVKDSDIHKLELYHSDNEKMALRLQDKKQKFVLLRMPHSTYNKFIQGNPDLPRLK